MRIPPRCIDKLYSIRFGDRQGTAKLIGRGDVLDHEVRRRLPAAVTFLTRSPTARLGRRTICAADARVAERLAHLLGVPEPLVSGPPFGDRGKVLALAHGVSQVYIAEADDPHGGRLDHRDQVALRVGHRLAPPRPGQRLALDRVLGGQRRRSGLGAVQNRAHEPIAQRSGKGELRDRQVLRKHDRQPNGAGPRGGRASQPVD